MELKYSIEFGKESKTIKLKKNVAGITLFSFLAIAALGIIYFSYTFDSILVTIAGIVMLCFSTFMTLTIATSKFEINLNKDDKKLRLLNNRLFRGTSVRSFNFNDMKHLAKKHAKIERGARRQDVYSLVLVLNDSEEVILINPTSDIKALDNIKNIITNYTDIKYQPNYSF